VAIERMLGTRVVAKAGQAVPVVLFPVFLRTWVIRCIMNPSGASLLDRYPRTSGPPQT
jgi:hypothetical protein